MSVSARDASASEKSYILVIKENNQIYIYRQEFTWYLLTTSIMRDFVIYFEEVGQATPKGNQKIFRWILLWSWFCIRKSDNCHSSLKKLQYFTGQWLEIIIMIYLKRYINNRNNSHLAPRQWRALSESPRPESSLQPESFVSFYCLGDFYLLLILPEWSSSVFFIFLRQANGTHPASHIAFHDHWLMTRFSVFLKDNLIGKNLIMPSLSNAS